tara:strand:+ start:2349 stop:2588 length:240 start_codon:yes stop_codon:yes gene_type:complete
MTHLPLSDLLFPKSLREPVQPVELWLKKDEYTHSTVYIPKQNVPVMRNVRVLSTGTMIALVGFLFHHWNPCQGYSQYKQ